LRDVLPIVVLNSIADHLRARGLRAPQGWRSGQAHEDTLTGHLFATLETDGFITAISNSTVWRWRIGAQKFSSGSGLAVETPTGADGIIEVEVFRPDGTIERKGLLFQAKKQWTHRDAGLVEQTLRMERISPNGSVVFSYSPSLYTATPGSEVLAADGRPSVVNTVAVGEFLADSFLPCVVGARAMHYDAVRRILTVPTPPSLPRYIRTMLRHRLKIIVQETAPR